MRKLFLTKNILRMFVLVLVATVMLVACQEKDPRTRPPVRPALSDQPDVILHITQELIDQIDEEKVVILPEATLSSSTIEKNARAISLEDLLEYLIVFENVYEGRKFTYQIVGSDEFTSRGNNNANDLQWSELLAGYLLLTTNPRRTYFPEFSSEGKYNYNVKDPASIQVFRTITVVKPNGDEVLFQLSRKLIEHVEIANLQNSNQMEESFKFDQLISTFITDKPEQYQYIVSSMDYPENDRARATLEWSHVQQAYYSRVIDRIFFPTTNDNPGNMRQSNVVRVTLMLPLE